MTSPDDPLRQAMLRNVQSERSFWVEDATLSERELRIVGQSIDQDAEPPEYEFSIGIAAAQWPALVQLLGGQGGEDVLDLLIAFYAGGGRGLTNMMNENDIEYSFWSRQGW